MSDGKAKRPLTQAEKDRAIFLYGQGIKENEIAAELNVDARKITGFIRSQINFGKLAPQNPKPPSPDLENSMVTPPPASPPPVAQPETAVFPPPPQAAPQTHQPAYAPTPPPPAAVPQHQAAAPGVGSDGWPSGRPVSGHSDGFTNQAQQLRTVIEREIAGGQFEVVGEHHGPFTREQACDIYGEGSYKALRYEPGKGYPIEHRFRAAASYGQPRTPRRGVDPQGSSARPAFSRPWNSWRNPSGAPEGEEEPRPPARPFMSSFSRPDPGPSAGAASEAASVEAIKQMGRMNEQIIEQVSKSRESGPDTFITNFFQNQQTLWEQRLAEEGRKADQVRKDEELRWNRRQEEMAAESRRRQEDADKAHQRELERIREEANSRERASDKAQKQLMDLENQRLEVLRAEHKNREDSLRDELKRNRDEIKETREAVDATIQASEQRFQQRFSEHEAALNREHELKQQHLKIDEQRQNEIINLKREAIQQAGGDQIFNTINTVIKEFSKGLEKIVDLKKIEALTPEAQAAAVAKGTIDGNMLGDPKRSQQAQPQENAAAAQAGGQKPAPGGAPAPAPAEESRTKEQEMELIIQAEMDRPMAKQMIKEWCLHIKRGMPPFMFANTYMEWMRDPMDHEGRKATSLFATFMSTRDWNDMMAVISPKLDAETLTVFRSEAAFEYYEGFRGLICEQVKAYWEEFAASRQALKAAQTAAGEKSAAAPAAAGEKK